MANTSSRMLRLLSLLQTHRYWPGAELAARLEVSERTLRRDIDRLRDLGYPVEAQRGVDGGYQLAPGTALPPLLLDDDEAVALAIGLRTAAHGPVAGIEEASVRALTKLVRIMPPHLRGRFEALRSATVPAVWGSGPTVDASLLTSIAQACQDEERLRFSYTTRDGEQAARSVEPYRLVSLGRRWYLVAFDLHRQDWRSFRLDRLADLRPTGMRFEPRPLPAEDAAEFVRSGIDNLPASYAIDVVVHAPFDTVRPTVGQWAQLEPIDSTCCRLRMTTDSLDWPALTLGALGADFHIVGPPELAEHLREWSARFARALAASSANAR
jgi:predicted DNA-binding transcriptional regulator YafY